MEKVLIQRFNENATVIILTENSTGFSPKLVDSSFWPHISFQYSSNVIVIRCKYVQTETK